MPVMTSPDRTPGGGHGRAWATLAVLWRICLLSYFSPVRHGWSRRAAVTASLLFRRRGRGVT